MAPTLEELLDMGEKHAHRILLKLKQPDLTPFYHLVVPGEPDVLVPVEFKNAHEKENTVTLITALAHTIHAVAVMFVSEAWAVTLSKEETAAFDRDGDITPPSQHKDRVEIVALIASDGANTRHRDLKIIRNRRGRIVGLHRDHDDRRNIIGGRMIDGIIPTTRH